MCLSLIDESEKLFSDVKVFFNSVGPVFPDDMKTLEKAWEKGAEALSPVSMAS